MNKKRKITAINQEKDDDKQDINIYTNENNIYYYSDVCPKSCIELIKCINKANKFLNSSKLKYKYINLHICSDGGEVYSAFSIIDIISSNKYKIITIAHGCVASAGVLISLAGYERHIHKHTYMLIHELRSGCWGKYSECIDDMQNNNTIMKDIKKYINVKCKNDNLKVELNDILKHDILWNATKCLKYGLVDKII